MFTLPSANGILGSMKYRLTTFTAVIAAAIIAVTLAGLSFFTYRTSLPVMADTSAVPAYAEAFSYGYLMSTPVAAVNFGDKTYILDESGNVSAYADGKFSSVTQTLVKSDESAPYDKLGVSEDKIYLYGKETVAACFDKNLYVIKSDKVTVTDAEGVVNENYALPESGNVFTAGYAANGKLYLIEYSESSSTNSLWSFDGTVKTKLENELACDGKISCMAVTDSGEIYYSTPYSVYSVSLSESINNIGGGITSLSADGDALLYAQTSGKICRYDDGISETLVASSGKISVSSRRRIIAVTDKGNNTLTVFRDGSYKKITAVKPEAVTIGYTGNVFVAGDKYITEYDGSLEETDKFTVGGNTSVITDICADRAEIAEDIIYALASDGTVYSSVSNEAIAQDAIAISAHPEGGFFALLSDGSVNYFASSDSESADETLASIDGAFDISTDRAGNVFRLTDEGIYKNDSASPAYEVSGLTSFAICECEFVSDGDVAGFGDFITIDPDSSNTGLIKSGDAGSDMKNGSEDIADYDAFKAPYDSGTPNDENYKTDIRKVIVSTEIYPFPVEMPSVFAANSDGNNDKYIVADEIPEGTFVTVIALYEDTDFCYAIAENRSGKESFKGFMNVKALGDPEQYADEEPTKAYVTEGTTVRKYPSLSAPEIDNFALTVNSSCTVMPFAENYIDAEGDAWYRIAYKYEDKVYDGYVKSYCISLSGSNMGHNVDPDFNGKIKCKDGAVCYDLIGEKYVENGNRLADGQQIEIVCEFTKANEYTHIRYVDENGETQECYVLTEYVRHTEAGVYQVVMFVIAAIVAAFIVILIVLKVRRKNKID